MSKAIITVVLTRGRETITQLLENNFRVIKSRDLEPGHHSTTHPVKSTHSGKNHPILVTSPLSVLVIQRHPMASNMMMSDPPYPASHDHHVQRLDDYHVQRLDMVDAELNGLNGQRVPEPIAHHGEQQQSQQQQQQQEQEPQ